MDTLILKLNASGDVVRTTPLLRRLDGRITWVTARKNLPLLDGMTRNLRCFAWERREEVAGSEYDLVINLEDEPEIAAFAREVKHGRIFGAFLDRQGRLAYSEDSQGWFDLSLSSRFGRMRADELKLQNRRAYQELIFEGLGLEFRGEPYVLPSPAATDLEGDVAIASAAGPVWPMKTWAHYERLAVALEAKGLRVNVLPQRRLLLEHLGDINAHRCVVGGDSLPMHLALGLGKRCVAIFNCTSPWEIYDYGLLTKLVSPVLSEFFYKRDFDPRATTAVGVDEVVHAVMNSLERIAA
jgi:heptosyltransferase II